MANNSIPIGPIINGVAALLPGILNTVGSLVKDKKAKKAWELAGEVATVIPTAQPAPTVEAKKKPVAALIAGGASLSSGRALNVGIVAGIAPVAASDILTNGVNLGNLALLGIVLFYSLGMTAIKSWSERS